MAGTEVGKGYLTVMPKATDFGSSLTSQLDGPFQQAGHRGGTQIGDGVAKSGKGSFLSAGGALGKVFVGAFAAIGAAQIVSSVVSWFGDAITAASDLAETQSKTKQIFGDATAAVTEYAETAATKLGQSEQTFLDGAATFGIFGQSAGLAGEGLSSFSVDMVKLATDLASFNNTSPEQAIEAIGAALRGEAEPIRSYGVLLDDATLKARAFALGIYDGTDALTPQQRVLAAQAEILAQTATQQGDFARTSGGMANQQRILNAQLENTKAEIGEALLPVATDLFKLFASEGVPALKDLAAWFIENKDQIYNMVVAFVDGSLSIVQAFFGIAEHMARMQDLWITVGTNIVQVFLNIFETIIDGAVNAFGWIPGVGDKLRDAQSSFDGFRDNVDAGFSSVRAAADETTRQFDAAQDAVAGLRDQVRNLDGATANVFLNAQGNMVATLKDGTFSVVGSGVRGRATGGPVRAGEPYIVGEREAELFVPNTSGRIYNQRQIAQMKGGSGAPQIVQNIHPQPGMSEQAIGASAGRALADAFMGVPL